MKRIFSLLIILFLFFLFVLNPSAVAGSIETQKPVVNLESNKIEGIEVPPTEKIKTKRLLLPKKAKDKTSKEKSSSTSTDEACECLLKDICVPCDLRMPRH